MCGMKSLIHSQTSKVQSLKFGNGLVIICKCLSQEHVSCICIYYTLKGENRVAGDRYPQFLWMFHFTSKRLESRKQKKTMWFQRRFEVASSRCIKNWCLDAVKASLTLKSEELIMKIVGSIQGTILSSNAHHLKRTIVYSDVTNSHVYLPG